MKKRLHSSSTALVVNKAATVVKSQYADNKYRKKSMISHASSMVSVLKKPKDVRDQDSDSTTRKGGMPPGGQFHNPHHHQHVKIIADNITNDSRSH